MIRIDHFKEKIVAVIGLGRSGLSAARALKEGGAKPVLWDDKASNLLQATKEGFAIEDLHVSDWADISALILSPGIALTHPEPHWSVLKAKEKNIEIIGDIELFARFVNGLPEHRRPRVIAITGTNGKSTTTALIGHILAHSGRSVHVGGNIGRGVLDLPEDAHPHACYVIETSSYQLDLCQGFAPDVGILLNLTPDHLDRHGDMDGYRAAKMRLFQSQGPGQVAVIGADDYYCQNAIMEIKQRAAKEGGPRLIALSARTALGEGLYALNGTLYDARSEPARPVFEFSRAAALPGKHNWQNAAAAFAACSAIGLKAEEIIDGLMSFGGLDHRCQEIGRIGKVRFINDSKATNADAARQAMSAYERFFWIAGGKAKQGGIDSLSDLFDRVKSAYLIGEAAEPFAKIMKGKVKTVKSKILITAVAQAYADAEKTGTDEVVLFSPACASFDQFTDFEARGNAFKAAVEEIKSTIMA